MGVGLSREQVAHLKEMGQLVEVQKDILKRKGEVPTKKGMQKFFRYVWEQCPSYPLKGTLEITTWERLGTYFYEEPRAPLLILLTWKSVMTALQLYHGIPIIHVSQECNNYESNKPTAPPRYEDLAPKNIEHPSPRAIPMPATSSFLKGSLEAGLEAARQNPNLTEEDRELLNMFPVTFAGQAPAYETLPFGYIKDLKNAIVTYGINSPYVKGLLENLAFHYKLAPNEWRALARSLLSITQYMLWHTLHKEACQEIQQRHPNLDIDELLGRGLFETKNQQLAIAAATLEYGAQAALKAFCGLDEFGSTSSSSFFKILQQNGEAYDSFIEKLQKAIDRQIPNKEANSILMRKLAFENANEDCRRVLGPLHSDSTKTLVDFLKAAAVVGSQVYNMETLAMAITSARDQQKGQRLGNCFNCGKPGHFKNQCRAPGGGKAPPLGGQRPNQPCPRCRRFGHWARECRGQPTGRPYLGRQGMQSFESPSTDRPFSGN